MQDSPLGVRDSMLVSPRGVSLTDHVLMTRLRNS